jgi:hypothetical protein
LQGTWHDPASLGGYGSYGVTRERSQRFEYASPQHSARPPLRGWPVYRPGQKPSQKEPRRQPCVLWNQFRLGFIHALMNSQTCQTRSILLIALKIPAKGPTTSTPSVPSRGLRGQEQEVKIHSTRHLTGPPGDGQMGCLSIWSATKGGVCKRTHSFLRGHDW